jgi:hypothetical protein
MMGSLFISTRLLLSAALLSLALSTATNANAQTIDTDGDGVPDALEGMFGLNPAVKDNDIFGRNQLFVLQQYRDFNGREADAAGGLFWQGQLDTGAVTRAALVEAYLTSREFEASVGPIARLYFGAYLRIADYAGLQFWSSEFRSGRRTLNQIAQAFASAPEFVARYGSIDDAGYVRLLYTNLLDRPADAAGLTYWLGELSSGRTNRGALLARFSESDEFKIRRRAEVLVTMTYVGMLRRSADQAGFTYWVGVVQNGASVQQLIGGFLTSSEYHDRFLDPMHMHHHSGPFINNALIPARTSNFFTTDRLMPTTEQPDVSNVGAFRISCKYSHMAYDDPIVFPGQPGRSHLHTFFGNTETNGNSTASSLLNSGNSTCTGGTINRSAYWIPSLINTMNGAPLAPSDAIFYYKGDGVPNIQPMPNGLRMIAGDARATTPPPQYSSHYRFHCERADFSSYNYGFVIPNCPAGDAIALELWFPDCWDGVNLDSADHKSHMAYASNATCPPSHPVVMPKITFNVSWRVPVGASGSQYRLSSDAYPMTSPGGYSMHGDWFMGWKPDVRDAWINGCLRASRDCHAHLLGDGRAMF